MSQAAPPVPNMDAVPPSGPFYVTIFARLRSQIASPPDLSAIPELQDASSSTPESIFLTRYMPAFLRSAAKHPSKAGEVTTLAYAGRATKAFALPADRAEDSGRWEWSVMVKYPDRETWMACNADEEMKTRIVPLRNALLEEASIWISVGQEIVPLSEAGAMVKASDVGV